MHIFEFVAKMEICCVPSLLFSLSAVVQTPGMDVLKGHLVWVSAPHMVDNVSAFDEGAAVAEWFSKYLGKTRCWYDLTQATCMD